MIRGPPLPYAGLLADVTCCWLQGCWLRRRPWGWTWLAYLSMLAPAPPIPRPSLLALLLLLPCSRQLMLGAST